MYLKKKDCLMLRNYKFLILIVISALFFGKVFSKEIPTIVIAPGKAAQSLSTVGSTVTVIDGETIRNSNESFLGAIIDQKSGSTNTFQDGGHGTNMGIQLRGLEKRYSTVYIDGVKMSDPSSPDNSFYFQNIMKESIDRVEILKGNQSSLYGPNAIGGTIHIFTKKGKPGSRSNIMVQSGSNDTNSIYYSADGGNDKISYYLGVNHFLTDGISAMNDNDESDSYKNKGLHGSLDYKFNENLKIENTLRLVSADFQYDAVNSSSTDVNDASENTEGSYSLKILYDKGKFNNSFSYNKTYIQRNTTETAGTFQNYFGYRDAFNFTGTYNFNLDNRLVYGLDAEFDAARYDGDYAPSTTGWSQIFFDKAADEHIYSQYFDYQFRPTKKIFGTFGLRSDEHSATGRKPSGRITMAYKLDNNSKIRSSLGSGVRFPSLYDLHYADGNTNASGGGTYSGDGYAGLKVEDLNSERANSYDFGYETFFDDLNLNLDVAYFYVEQKNPLNSDKRNNWKMMNTMGINYAKGVELGLKWKPKNTNFEMDFDYTYTDSYDSNNCYDGCTLESGMRDAKVRVPKNTFTSIINHKTLPGLNNSLIIKYVDETRDFGNANNSWADVLLDDYITFGLSSNYRIFDNINLTFDVTNLLDTKYEQSYQYSQMGRSLNIGLKRVY